MLPLIAGPLISGGIGLIGGLINNLFAKKNAENTNQANKEIAQETNNLNKEIADQNFAFQQDWNEYQKALQQQIFEREDTAYQRTAKDMMAAGLNPLSMQGTNGAGQIVSTTAPQNNFQAQQPAAMQQANLALDSMSTMISGITSIFSQINEMKKGNIERDLLQQQVDHQKLINDMLSRESKHKIDIGQYDTDMLPEKIMTHILDWTKNGRFGQAFDFNLKDMMDFFSEDKSIGVPFLDDIKKLIYNEVKGPENLAERIYEYQEEKERQRKQKHYEEIKNNEHVQKKFNEYKQQYGGR